MSGAGVTGTNEVAGVTGTAVVVEAERDPRRDAALRARLRWILAGIVLLCLVLGALGFAFVRWMASLPPGVLKTP